MGTAEVVDDVVDLRFSHGGVAEHEGETETDGGTSTWGYFENAGVVFAVGAEGELAVAYLHAGVKDADTGVDEYIVETWDDGGVVGGLYIVYVEEDGECGAGGGMQTAVEVARSAW